MSFDGKAFGQQVVKAVKEYVDRKTTPLHDRIAYLERQIAERPAPVDGVGVRAAILDDSGCIIFTLTDGNLQKVGPVKGKDGIDGRDGTIDPGLIAEVVNGEVQRAAEVIEEKVAGRLKETCGALVDAAISARPVLQRDRSDDAAEIAAAVEAGLAKAVAALPVPKDGIDGKSVTLDDVAPFIRSAIQSEVATLPVPKDGQSVTLDDVRPLVQSAVVDAVLALPTPKNGQDGKDADPAEVARIAGDEVIAALKEMLPDPVAVEAMIADAAAKVIAAFPAPKDGKDADPAEIERMVGDKLAAAMATYPVPQDGRSVTVEDVTPLIVEAVSQEVAKGLAALPAPKDGQPGKDVDQAAVDRAISVQIGEAVAALPKPQDGKSVTLADVAPLITEAVGKAVATIPPPVGVRSALVDRSGALVVTLTDGSVCPCGSVAGRDGQDISPEAVRAMIEKEMAKVPAPKDGRDGFGFDDMTIEQDGPRRMVVRFTRGDDVKEFALVFPVQVNRGVYIAGQKYERGDLVTWAGSQWHCEKDTEDKPGEGSDDWKLAVKRGRDGRDARNPDADKPKTNVPLT